MRKSALHTVTTGAAGNYVIGFVAEVAIDPINSVECIGAIAPQVTNIGRFLPAVEAGLFCHLEKLLFRQTECKFCFLGTLLVLTPQMVGGSLSVGLAGRV